MKAWLVGLFFLFAPVAVDAPQQQVSQLPTLKVTATPRQAFAPKSIMVKIVMRPEERNRYLKIELVSPDAPGTSTEIQVDGVDQRAEMLREYRNMSPGNYTVEVTLFDRERRAIAKDAVTVIRM